MTEEEVRQLKHAYAEIQEQAAEKDQRIEELEALLKQALRRIEELEGRIAKNSHNSSKPPSSDGLRRKPHAQRKTSDKPTGGQAGHQGRTLLQVASADEVVSHRPESCEHCQRDLREVAGSLKERRQIHDLPKLGLWVKEHRVEVVCCPRCHHVNRGDFPAGVDAPAQYGPKVQALAVYLSQFHLLPMQRTCEVLSDLCECALSEGTLSMWIAQASRSLEPTLQRIKHLLSGGRLQHADETGMRIKGTLHWTHVSCTRWLTYYAWHRKRGKKALESIGIWPHFHGRAMHDRWASYEPYGCAHSLCGAHLVRDCLYLAEQEQQEWAQGIADLLLGMAKAAQEWRTRGASAVPKEEREAWLAQYFEVLASGFAAQGAHAPPSDELMPKRRGKPKQSAAKNLLDVLLQRAGDVLSFLNDLSVPFSNNLAERDLRMIKVQQKISGTFRSEDGATAFCTIRSYLSTMRKQGRPLLAAMAAVFAGSPFSVAWGPG